MSVGRLILILAIGIGAIAFSLNNGSAFAQPHFTNGATVPHLISRLFLSAQQSPPAETAQIGKRAKGIELYRQSNFVEASKILRIAVKENKTDHEAWYYLGLALLQQPGKNKDATKSFETVLKLQPRFASAHTGLAYAALQRHKSSDAVLESRAALSIDPSLAEPHFIIGVVHIRAGDPGEALLEANEAIRLNPGFARSYLLKSQAQVGVYAKQGFNMRRTSQGPHTSPTSQERDERRRQRESSSALLKEAAASLQTYLKMDPSSSTADLWREQLETLEFYGGHSGSTSAGGDRPVFGDEVTTKARILMKPEAAYTEEARQAQIVGTIVLRAVLTADGSVRHILVLDGLPNGLTEAAVRAARLIKFIPATVDGKAVSTFVQLEYNFNLY